MPNLVEIGPNNLTTLIQKSTYINEGCYIVYIYVHVCIQYTYNMYIHLNNLEHHIYAVAKDIYHYKNSLNHDICHFQMNGFVSAGDFNNPLY